MHAAPPDERCWLYAGAGPAEDPEPAASSSCRVWFWSPSVASWRPPAAPASYYLWTIMHALRLFQNRDYCVCLILDGASVLHRSAVFPGWFRFPFMAAADLQIGDTWTRSDARGRGLATLAIRRIQQQFTGRRIWYVVGQSNVASIKAAERAGLRRDGALVRTRVLGVRLLGAFRRAPADGVTR